MLEHKPLKSLAFNSTTRRPPEYVQLEAELIQLVTPKRMADMTKETPGFFDVDERHVRRFRAVPAIAGDRGSAGRKLAGRTSDGEIKQGQAA